MHQRVIHIILSVGIICTVSGLSWVYAQSPSRTHLEKERRTVQQELTQATRRLKRARTRALTASQELHLLEDQVAQRKRLDTLLLVRVDSVRTAVAALKEKVIQLEARAVRQEAQYKQLLRRAFVTKVNRQPLLAILAEGQADKMLRAWALWERVVVTQKQRRAMYTQTRTFWRAEQDSLAAVELGYTAALAAQVDNKSALEADVLRVRALVEQLKKQEARWKQRVIKKKAQKEALNQAIEDVILKELRAQKTTIQAQDTTKRRAAKVLEKLFRAQRNKLPMPVASGVIIRGFGKHPHPIFKMVTTENNGVDIQASKGAKVRAVFEGEVVSVFTIPGMQSAVMLKHGNYYTTYSNLVDVRVVRGDYVQAKAPLGLVYTDPNTQASVMHFEVWRGKYKLNPKYWLDD